MGGEEILVGYLDLCVILWPLVYQEIINRLLKNQLKVKGNALRRKSNVQFLGFGIKQRKIKQAVGTYQHFRPSFDPKTLRLKWGKYQPPYLFKNAAKIKYTAHVSYHLNLYLWLSKFYNSKFILKINLFHQKQSFFSSSGSLVRAASSSAKLRNLQQQWTSDRLKLNNPLLPIVCLDVYNEYEKHGFDFKNDEQASDGRRSSWESRGWHTAWSNNRW